MADEITVTVTPSEETPLPETPAPETPAPETPAADTATLEQQHEETILASAVVSEQVQNVDTQIRENQSWLENAVNSLMESQSRLTTSIAELVSEMRTTRNPPSVQNPSTESASQNPINSENPQHQNGVEENPVPKTKPVKTRRFL